MENSVRCDYLPGCRYKIWQDAGQFCFTTDAVFLGHFPHLVRQAKVLELGCGTGAISMLLESRGAAHVTAVDCNPQVTELLRRSVEDNMLQEKFTVVDGDIRSIREIVKPESMDLVAANPPYRNSGNVRQIGTAACHEVTATLEDFFQAAAYAVRFRGRFALVQLPERFELEYTGADGEKHRPVMIHRAPFGSMERFVAVLIEHTAGKFPLWLTPEQVVILPISEKFNDYAEQVKMYLKTHEIRAIVDDRNEKIGRKIRDNEMKRIPYMLIVGEKEAENGEVSVRRQGEGDKGTMKFEEFAKILNEEVQNMINKW